MSAEIQPCGDGSVYLGGFTFADLVRASQADELTRGAVARADALSRRTSSRRAPRSSEAAEVSDTFQGV